MSVAPPVPSLELSWLPPSTPLPSRAHVDRLRSQNGLQPATPASLGAKVAALEAACAAALQEEGGGGDAALREQLRLLHTQLAAVRRRVVDGGGDGSGAGDSVGDGSVPPAGLAPAPAAPSMVRLVPPVDEAGYDNEGEEESGDSEDEYDEDVYELNGGLGTKHLDRAQRRSADRSSASPAEIESQRISVEDIERISVEVRLAHCARVRPASRNLFAKACGRHSALSAGGVAAQAARARTPPPPPHSPTLVCGASAAPCRPRGAAPTADRGARRYVRGRRCPRLLGAVRQGGVRGDADPEAPAQAKQVDGHRAQRPHVRAEHSHLLPLPLPSQQAARLGAAAKARCVHAPGRAAFVAHPPAIRLRPPSVCARHRALRSRWTDALALVSQA